METVNCEYCVNFKYGSHGHYCLLGKRILFRKTELPGIKDHPGYRRKCEDYTAKTATTNVLQYSVERFDKNGKQHIDKISIPEHNPSTGKDFLGMPVVGNRKLLVPVIEIKRFAEYALQKNGVILPTLEMGELYTDYVTSVIKPKYKKQI